MRIKPNTKLTGLLESFIEIILESLMKAEVHTSEDEVRRREANRRKYV